jgi:hypothetical protein
VDGAVAAQVLIVITAYSAASVASGAFSLNYTFVPGLCGAGLGPCLTPTTTVFQGLGITHPPTPAVTPTVGASATPSPAATQTVTPFYAPSWLATPSPTPLSCNVPGGQLLPPLSLPAAPSRFVLGSAPGAPSLLWSAACSDPAAPILPATRVQAVYYLEAPAISGSITFSTCSAATNFATSVSGDGIS